MIKLRNFATSFTTRILLLTAFFVIVYAAQEEFSINNLKFYEERVIIDKIKYVFFSFDLFDRV